MSSIYITQKYTHVLVKGVSGTNVSYSRNDMKISIESQHMKLPIGTSYLCVQNIVELSTVLGEANA